MQKTNTVHFDLVPSLEPTGHLGGSGHSRLFFFSLQLQQLQNKSKRRSRLCESNVFSSGCLDAVSHSQMKSDSEIRAQWVTLLSLSNVYYDRNGNDAPPPLFFASETLNVAKEEEGEIKAGELQMLHIDFHENRVSLSEDQSLSALRARRISHWVRLMTSPVHSASRHRSAQTCANLVWEPLFRAPSVITFA